MYWKVVRVSGSPRVEEQPRVVVAAGGTAGHVMPAIAVADALKAEGALVTFLGTADRAEAELVPEAGYEIDFVDVSGMDRRNPLKAAAALAKAAAALPGSRRILRSRGATALLGGGGYVAGPAGLAAASMGVPIVLTEADSHLGLTNRVLASRAERVCLAFPIEGRDGPRYVVTGRPVSGAIAGSDRAAARERFDLHDDERCVLVVGGSLGARSINDCAVKALARDQRVIHVSGHRDHQRVEQALAAHGSPQGYDLLAFEKGLGEVLAACDLVVGRAGGSIFELCAAGRPAVLIPYPHATGDHQRENARWMERAGAAVVLADEDLSPDLLRATVDSILTEPGRLQRMSAAATALARPNAARDVAAEVLRAGRSAS